MAGVNKVIIMGHLGRDPEIRYSGDLAIANLAIATSEKFKDKSGNVQERTEWHRVVLFGRSAEVAGEYLKKGSMAYIEGRLQTKKWTDKEGMERYTTEILGDRLQLVGGRSDSGDGERPAHRQQQSTQQRPQQSRPASAPAPMPEPEDDWDDVPF